MRRYLRIAGRGRWAALGIALTAVLSLGAITTAADAVVVNDQGTLAGVALMPGGNSLPAGMAVTSSGPCVDPAMAFTPDLAYLPNSQPLCDRGGSVMHSNETFAVTWDPGRSYWASTRGYVEQFLRDVADGSGSGTSPYADTTQYTDGSGRAGNSSTYGGGCIDYGNPTNSSNQNTTCLFGSSVQTGPGYNYPSPQSCTATGNSWNAGYSPNTTCVTDGDIQQELRRLVPQTGMLNHLQPGHTPLVAVLLPTRVEVCLDATNNLCSANSDSTLVKAQFCSYHSEVQMPGGNKVAYVVQPWTSHTGCDEPKLPALPPNPTPQQLATDAGSRLVSPLSAGQIAAISNPGLNGWVASDGSEINDNGSCMPFGADVDTVPLGNRSYALQREYNNAAAIETDPNTYFGCAPNVLLTPSFVVPSAVEPGDVVVFDGSTTASTLLVPNTKYLWDFGDGTGATGPSVTHSYAKGGSFTVRLTVTDRGGNVQSLGQTISVLGANGVPVPPSNPPTGTPGNVGSKGSLKVRMQLLPEGLKRVLRSGIAAEVSSNGPANGIASVKISRATARQLHIRLGRGPYVVLGQGTLSSVKDGTVFLRFSLSRSAASKLKHSKHLTLWVTLQLVGAAGDHLTIDAAGRY